MYFIVRELVMELLSQQPPGSFIVRESSSNPGCHALSVVAQDWQILHYLLVRDSQGYFIQVTTSSVYVYVCVVVVHHHVHVYVLPFAMSMFEI